MIELPWVPTGTEQTDVAGRECGAKVFKRPRLAGVPSCRRTAFLTGEVGLFCYSTDLTPSFSLSPFLHIYTIHSLPSGGQSSDALTSEACTRTDLLTIGFPVPDNDERTSGESNHVWVLLRGVGGALFY